MVLLLAGLRVYYPRLGYMRIAKRGRYNFCLRVVAVLTSITLWILILAESLDGITQVFLNSLSKGEDPLYAYIIVGFFCLVLLGVLGILALTAVSIGAWTKLGYLSEMRHREMRRFLRVQESLEETEEDEEPEEEPEEESEEEEEPQGGELLFFPRRSQI